MSRFTSSTLATRARVYRSTWVMGARGQGRLMAFSTAFSSILPTMVQKAQVRPWVSRSTPPLKSIGVRAQLKARQNMLTRTRNRRASLHMPPMVMRSVPSVSESWSTWSTLIHVGNRFKAWATSRSCSLLLISLSSSERYNPRTSATSSVVICTASRKFQKSKMYARNEPFWRSCLNSTTEKPRPQRKSRTLTTDRPRLQVIPRKTAIE
mmetsp:Transcript_16086/g.46874  ORF Transcript_16086/g.46874 Transcript_16086/m.46874 type:complete len:209 (-) Transcript_16086:984-1610(-)